MPRAAKVREGRITAVAAGRDPANSHLTLPMTLLQAPWARRAEQAAQRARLRMPYQSGRRYSSLVNFTRGSEAASSPVGISQAVFASSNLSSTGIPLPDENVSRVVRPWSPPCLRGVARDRRGAVPDVPCICGGEGTAARLVAELPVARALHLYRHFAGWLPQSRSN